MWIQYIRHNLLVVATLCFISGAVLARSLLPNSLDQAHVSLPAAIFLAGAGLLFCLISQALKEDAGRREKGCAAKRQWLQLAGLCLLLVSSGYIHTWRALLPPADPHHIYNLVPGQHFLTLRGRITGLVRQGRDKSSFTLELSHILYRDRQPAMLRPATGKVMLSLRGHLPDTLAPGMKIMVLAKVRRIKNYQTPGVFDYVLYMRNKGVYCSGWIPGYRAIRIEKKCIEKKSDRGKKPAQTLQQARQNLARFLDTHLDPVSSGLYQALLIGNRSRLEKRIGENFAASGCMHLLAISGLHLGLLGLALYKLFLFAGKRIPWLMLHGNIHELAILPTVPLLLIYAAIAGQGAPVMRALIMAILVSMAFVLRRQHSLLHLLCAAALFLLVLRPLALFTASFQLSFAAMLGILLFAPALQNFWSLATDRHRNNFFGRMCVWLGGAFFLALIATAANLPLLLYHFNRFSPLGPLMNLIIEPLLCFIALPLGLIGSLMIPVHPELAAATFQLGGHALHLADRLTSLAARLPLATIWTITPTIPEIILYVLILLLAGRPILPRRTRFSLISALFLGLILHFTSGLLIHNNRSTATISFLDVGRGSSTLIEFTNGATTLIDGGGSFSRHFNVGERIIAPFLWKKRYWRLNSLIITHPDSDHYNGLDFILRRFHPEIIYTNGQQDRSPGYVKLMQQIQSMRIHIQVPRPGQLLSDDNQLCRLTGLGMKGLADQQDTDNNQSLVSRLTCGDISFLFPGDIERQAEHHLIKQNRQLRATVLLAPHHGSKTSTSRSFFSLVDPELVVVSGKDTPVFSHGLRSRTVPVHYRLLITGKDGTISCITDGTGLTVSTWNDHL